MRKYLWPILVIALALMAAGAWVFFPKARTTVTSTVSSFCSSFAEHAKDAWARLFPPAGEAIVPELDIPDDDNLADNVGHTNSTVATALGAIADPASDPDPAKLTPEQRKRRYKELLAAADARKHEVMRSNLMKSEEGREALKATRAFQAKADEIKRLDQKHGWTDNRLWALRLELAPLRDNAIIANARYKAWKDAHPSEVVDPDADKLYKNLIYRSRFFKD